MPASRLRTGNWRQSLQQVYERRGALEISMPTNNVATDQDESSEVRGGDLVWRVKILGISDDEILVESPVTLGQALCLNVGTRLVAGLVIGQNRWVFATSVLGHQDHRSGPHRRITALRLFCPEKVKRCSRRTHNRLSTNELNLPTVRCWPLLDPASASYAEKANQAQFEWAAQHNTDEGKPSEEVQQLTLPEVGPPFDAQLANVGGGGLGLLIDPSNTGAVTRHRNFWLRFALPPEMVIPLAVTARLVHTHMDSAQRTYAGMAFEFGHHKEHAKFVANQIAHYVDQRQQSQQTEQLRKVS